MNDYELWFACVKLPFNKKYNLINSFISAENLWKNYISGNGIKLFDADVSLAFTEAMDNKKLDMMKKIIYESEIKSVSINDEDYPENIKSRHPYIPYCIFYKGNIGEINKKRGVAIIGSRKNTFYGEEVTAAITKVLCTNNYNIISGMAKGIDSIAHKSALLNNGFTTAVLGSGLNIVYPKENIELFNEICKSGCALTYFLPNTSPIAKNFPLRNYIIEYLCDKIIITEAGEHSGALITARISNDLSSKVYAVPGSVFSNQSIGTNSIINDGAKVIYSIERLCEIFDVPYTKAKTEESAILDEKSNKIISVIGHTPIHINDIIKLTNIDIRLIYGLLFEMQSKKLITSLAGSYYVKIEKFK